jgi:hypothetical protein
LWLHSNDLTGPISTELGQCTALVGLTLSGNIVNSTIPSELESLSRLKYLYLDSNMLSGRIPSELGMLYNLMALRLQENRLSGAIPEQVFDLATEGSLESWNISDNVLLTGTIPDATCSAVSDLVFDCTRMLCGCASCACSKGAVVGNNTG